MIGRKKKSSSTRASRSSSAEKEKLKEGQIDTGLGAVDLHFVVENTTAKSCVYDFFKFSSRPNFTVGVDPFETMSQNEPTDVYICFCENSLGPCDPKSFAHTISLYVNRFILKVKNNNIYIPLFHFYIYRRFGRKKDIEKGIYSKYLGEIPPNSPFCYSITEKTELLFVVLDSANSLAVYHATRVALLHVMKKRGMSTRARMNSSGNQQHELRAVSKKNLKIPDAFKNIDNANTSTSSASMSRSQSVREPRKRNTIEHITFLVCSSINSFNQTQIVYQMAKAYSSLLTNSMNTTLANLESRYNKCRNIKNISDDKRKKKLSTMVKREELVRRGILSEQEVDWVLNWLIDESSLPMQLAAAVTLVNYIQSEK